MDLLEVPAQEVRLSSKVGEALAEGRPVAVTRYGKRLAVILSEEQFDLIAPLLELLQEGTVVPPDMLKTAGDRELERALAQDREPTPEEDAQIAELLRSSQS